MKDALPDNPNHFVVETIWFHTLDKPAGLEITEVELIPPFPSPSAAGVGTSKIRKPVSSPNAQLLARIDKNDLPKAYNPTKHQDYVDRRIAGLSDKQRAKISELWKEKQRIDPAMPNRGFSFVKIMEYVAAHLK
jgi:hypothetical protein